MKTKKESLVPQPLINFVHANGIVATAYSEFFSLLQHNVLAKHQYVHDPAFPLNNHWTNQVDELLDYLGKYAQQPVIGMGHSFGAVVTYKAACLRPDLFHAIVMCDPPVMTGIGGLLFGWSKKTRWIDKITPAKMSMARKQVWPKDTNIVQYFANKPLFKALTPNAVYGYATGITAIPSGQTVNQESVNDSLSNRHSYALTYRADLEANTFRTIPHDIDDFKGTLKVPGLLLTGTQTNVTYPYFRKRFMKNNPQLLHREVEGGHMFVLENPVSTSAQINDFLGQLTCPV
ncbi:MAG: alpha/beta hydrolase [Glaciecola sp.]|jgi:pimeloyl-ACP methyl ester carboxylesterase